MGLALGRLPREVSGSREEHCHGGKQQLERLAFCYGLTQRTMLERILAEIEHATVDKLPTKAQSDYYERRCPLRA